MTLGGNISFVAVGATAGGYIISVAVYATSGGNIISVALIAYMQTISSLDDYIGLATRD